MCRVTIFMITATLPPYAQPGMRVDVTVSSLGNARSLFGGTLLQTPLFGADKKVYAVAQGPVLTGGFTAQGVTGTSYTRNHTTANRVPEGALVERQVPMPDMGEGPLVLNLREPSFVNATRIVAAIDAALGAGTATALDGGRVQVKLPSQYDKNPVALLAAVQVIEVDPDSSAKVVIDERTGTVVVGAAVRISEVAIAQGSLTVEIMEQQLVSQPSAFTSRGNAQTAVVPSSQVEVTQGAATDPVAGRAWWRSAERWWEARTEGWRGIIETSPDDEGAEACARVADARRHEVMRVLDQAACAVSFDPGPRFAFEA